MFLRNTFQPRKIRRVTESGKSLVSAIRKDPNYHRKSIALPLPTDFQDLLPFTPLAATPCRYLELSSSRLINHQDEVSEQVHGVMLERGASRTVNTS
jgi:hypothetical protein